MNRLRHELQPAIALWNYFINFYQNARLALLFTNAWRSIHDSKAINSRRQNRQFIAQSERKGAIMQFLFIDNEKLCVYKDGKVVEKSVGLTSKPELASMLIRHI